MFLSKLCESCSRSGVRERFMSRISMAFIVPTVYSVCKGVCAEQVEGQGHGGGQEQLEAVCLCRLVCFKICKLK